MPAFSASTVHLLTLYHPRPRQQFLASVHLFSCLFNFQLLQSTYSYNQSSLLTFSITTYLTFYIDTYPHHHCTAIKQPCPLLSAELWSFVTASSTKNIQAQLLQLIRTQFPSPAARRIPSFFHTPPAQSQDTSVASPAQYPQLLVLLRTSAPQPLAILRDSILHLRISRYRPRESTLPCWDTSSSPFGGCARSSRSSLLWACL